MTLSLTSILTIIFVVAKLMGAFPYSWWWVFSPTLIPVAIGLVVSVIAGALATGTPYSIARSLKKRSF